MFARILFVLSAGAALLAAVALGQGRGDQNDWPTAYGDAQHSSWLRTGGNISTESMRQGFGLQWSTKLDSPARDGASLTQGVIASGVNIFTPLSAVAGASNLIFAVDNDTGNLFWTRRFDPSPSGSAACPGGISGAPTRTVNLVPAAVSPATGGGGGRGGRTYSSAVGAPGEGVPLPTPGGGRAGAGRGPAVPAPVATAAPASPFPTNPAAVAAASRGGGGLFRASAVMNVVSGDGMIRKLGFVSGKDIQRPTQFLPPGARFSDLIAVGDMVYTTTTKGCGGAPNGIWAIGASGDPNSVVSWKTNGGEPLGSVAFSTNGTLIAAIGPGNITAGGYANAIVALDPKTLALKDWFLAGVELAAAPVLFQENGRDIVAVTTKEGRVLLLNAAALGGANHATPLFASTPLTGGTATFTGQLPATWRAGETRFLLLPIAGPLASLPGATGNGPISTGAVLAVKIGQQGSTFSVQPAWVSENITTPLTPIVVNDVAFVSSGGAGAPAKLYALHGVTGHTLWQSGNAMRAAVSGRSFWTGAGQIFVGTTDGTIYAFGFDMERGAPDKRSGF